MTKTRRPSSLVQLVTLRPTTVVGAGREPAKAGA